VTDQELIYSALRQISLIVAEHLELGVRDAGPGFPASSRRHRAG
jgi:hypothetical protein